jgi:serine/threonine protein kinase
MAHLRHPNVVQFLGHCSNPPAIITEHCARGCLYDVIQRAIHSPDELPWSRRLEMALDAAKGMLYLHTRRPPIVHRDLKSPNLLVDEHSRVKVADFNLSKIWEENAAMTSTMSSINPRWVAPEVLDGQRATMAADVFGFGVVLWELLTWQLPWGNGNMWLVSSAA